MKNSIQLNKIELVLLELVAKGAGNWSWDEIGQALSSRDVERETDMMVAIIKKLAVDGLLKRYVEPGNPRYRPLNNSSKAENNGAKSITRLGRNDGALR